MEVKLLQYAKHKEPIDVTDAGMVIEVKLLHPQKQTLLNDVTDGGIVIEVKFLQSQYLLLADYQCYTL